MEDYFLFFVTAFLNALDDPNLLPDLSYTYAGELDIVCRFRGFSYYL